MDTTANLPAGVATRLSLTRLVRSRLVIGVVTLGVIAVAAAWQWSWAVAIGAAPFLLSVAPCAAMCGLGLCMHRTGGGSCGATNSQTPATQPDPGQIANSPDRTINMEN
jgi:hypothetical protein